MLRKSSPLFVMLSLGVLVIGFGCKGKPPATQPETQTPVTTEPESRPSEPTQPSEPPKVDLQESQFRTVYFDFDKYNLRADAREALDHNVRLLKDFPDVIVKIEGHCDERGTIEYNLALGEKRARSSMDYLFSQGIAANRVSVISYGKERPEAMGHDETSWQKNRRSEFRIISQ